mgnify:FL=1
MPLEGRAQETTEAGPSSLSSELSDAQDDVLSPQGVEDDSEHGRRLPTRSRRQPLFLTYDADFNQVCSVSGSAADLPDRPQEFWRPWN